MSANDCRALLRERDDLLAALKAMLDSYGRNGDVSSASMELAENAIAKAESR